MTFLMKTHFPTGSVSSNRRWLIRDVRASPAQRARRLRNRVIDKTDGMLGGTNSKRDA
jgi:hypothetical protein